jgi:Insertion element 4 transposase N-terminal/Transposase DDE domain
MLGLQGEVAELAQAPTDERVRALKRIIPCTTVKAILKKGGQDIHCARVPKWFMVWFVVGMGLFCTDSYRQIFRWLTRFQREGTPGRSTLCEARQRLGVAPLHWLFHAVVKLRGTATMPGCFYRGLRLMSLDGFILDVPDTPDNDRIFGRPRNGHSSGAFPQVRTLALCEVGTHILWRYLIKPVRRAEITMACALLRFLVRNMLVLWDRGFLSYAHVAQVLSQKAHLLARVKIGLIFIPQKRLPDGSYLAKLYASAKHRRRDRDGIVVRIIEYTFRDPGRPGSGQPHRLLTTMLDWRLDPAKRLIELYHERWEEELAIDELKTHQRQRPVLRSQTPAGVVQEICGLFLGHYVVRVLMCEAASRVECAPRHLSFTATLKILRCRLPECPRSDVGRRRWYDALLMEIGQERLEPRRDRINPRVIKRKVSKWLKKRPEHRRYPQPTKRFSNSLVMLR